VSDPYGRRGRVGLLVPQANAVAEAEAAILMPRGVGLVTARLTSPKPTIEARLADYLDGIVDTAGRFGGVRLDAIGFACTGASYPLDPVDEDARLAACSTALGAPVISAARAVVDALNALGARRIALISPYPEALTRASERYWAARGFGVAQVVPVQAADAAIPAGAHPIYALSDEAVRRALDAVDGARADAVVLLGTGIASLPAIAARPRVDAAPVLSCMLALAWACARPIEADSDDDAVPVEPGRARLLRWIDGFDWIGRLDERR
jgi:maleate isomerase